MLSLGSASALAVLSFTSLISAQNTQTCPYTPAWNLCTGSTTHECATILTQKDWKDKDQGEVQLRLIRYPARNADGTVKTDVNSVVVNPGGPGSSGIGYLLSAGVNLNRYAL